MMASQEVLSYNQTQSRGVAGLCELLMNQISQALPGAHARLYHANPVWFLDENPIVGYDVSEKGVNILFWSGKSFATPGLTPKGSFQAAGTTYREASEMDTEQLQKWLEESKAIQWDYKNLRKNNGELVCLG